ncbi:MAG TPA: HEAT repeat domain-containing protein, partial [Luteimonas sp.]|nr:HEAT repeat domain-containing protein [Luteimonas sp.]
PLRRVALSAVGWAVLAMGCGSGRDAPVPSAAVALDGAVRSTREPAGLQRAAATRPGVAATRRERPTGAVDLPATLACAGTAARPAALECLQQLDALGMGNADVRDAFLKRLALEPDPRARADILARMTPVPLAREDLAPLLQALDAARTAGDPVLRAAALLQMAQWDRGDGVAGALRDGLQDPDPDVVRAAVRAAQASNVRTQEVKDALLVLAHDAAPGSELRGAAVDALGDFSLDRGEYALYGEAAGTLPGRGSR